MSSDTIVRCADCGVPNRLFAHGSKGRYRCGRCGEVIAPARNWSAPTKLLLIACLAAFGWGAWPVSGWLALSAFAAWTLGSTAERLFPPALDQPKAIVRPTLRLTMQNLAKATAYVAIGIAIVGLAQIALSLLGGVSADALRETELFLSDMRLALNAALGVENLLIALGALVALVMIFPRSRLMAEVLRARSALGRLYLVVLGITSSTFFSAIDVT